MQDLVATANQITAEYSSDEIVELLRAPLIIVAAPRSGSTLLFERLMQHPGSWSIGGESHGIFRAFPRLRAANAQLDSGALTAAHADPATAELFRRCFVTLLRSHRGEPWIKLPDGSRPARVMLVEKTPRNALNVPFLRAVFPGARFLYLYRDARASVASIVEAWELGLRTGRFVTFRDLPGWDRGAWCFLLPEGWRDLRGKSLFDIAAFQWARSNAKILDDLADVDADRRKAISYEQLLDDPLASLEQVAQFAGAASNPPVRGELPLSRTTVSPPARDKWRRVEAEVTAVADAIDPIEERIRSTVREWR
jgi:hypothetical protein